MVTVHGESSDSEPVETNDARAVYDGLQAGGTLTLSQGEDSATYNLSSADRWNHSHDDEERERMISFRLTQGESSVGRLVMTPTAARIGFPTDSGEELTISVPTDRGDVPQEDAHPSGSGPTDSSGRCSMVYELVEANEGHVHLRWTCG